MGPYVNGKCMGKNQYLYASAGKTFESNWADDGKRAGDQALVNLLAVALLSPTTPQPSVATKA